MRKNSNHYSSLNTDQKIALATELYYLYHLPQAKIAEVMGISRPWVSKLLSRAEEMNLVKISVLTPTSGVVGLEDALIKKYGIGYTRVVKNVEGLSPLRSCSLAASHYLISSIRPNDKIGVGFGRTVASLIDIFDSVYFPGVMVVPLVGGLGDNSSIMSNYLAEKLASNLSCEFKRLHAPAFLDGKTEKSYFLNDTGIKEVFDIANSVDIALFSPGDVSPDSSLLRDRQISSEEYADFISSDIVGDIALNFYDSNGVAVKHKIYDRTIAVDFDIIRKNARDKVAIALGKSKVPAIHAALKGGWIDTLITDAITAGLLLSF